MKKIDNILILSIFIIFWIDYIPYKFPSIIDNSDKLEMTIYNLSLAYIAGYMFYYINVYLPEHKKSRVLKRILNNDIVFILNRKSEINRLKCVVIDENVEVVMNGKYIPIRVFLNKFHVSFHRNLDSILIVRERLPVELLRIILIIKKHPHFISKFTNLKELDKYIESYNTHVNKLNEEFLKL
ncbi:hypothetical protein [Flavobacterium sp. 14A]|uniref:hypothetical protein n=1 Tax=Flavobacterium sp. 14A TaxID=2735896 RepID=UPI001571501F|nr:hypothetical protein [Flavobacterium sp. 14A]NRT13003.1 hypothetical protein [Flavobacterium sp. 14A]